MNLTPQQLREVIDKLELAAQSQELKATAHRYIKPVTVPSAIKHIKGKLYEMKAQFFRDTIRELTMLLHDKEAAPAD